MATLPISFETVPISFEIETALTQVKRRIYDAFSRQPRTDGEEKKRIHAVPNTYTCDSVFETVPGRAEVEYSSALHYTCDSVFQTVPGRAEVEFSRQPWTNQEIERLVDAVQTHGEWGEWVAIALFVSSRSEAECCLKRTSTKPIWTPEEDMLLAAAVKVCDKGYWTPVAARVPGRTMMDCRNRWTILAKLRTSRTSTTDLLPWRSGGAMNPVGEVETCKEGNRATIAAVVPGLVRSELQRVIKRQRLSASVAAAPNQSMGVPPVPGGSDLQRRIKRLNMTAPRSPPFSSVNDGAWVPHQFPLPGQSNRQHLSPSAAAVPFQPMGVPPMNVTATRSPPFPSVNGGTWIPHQLPPGTVVSRFQHPPPIYGFPAGDK
jgi:hypothetical protein